MPKFPKPLPIPDKVTLSRNKRNQEIFRAVKIGIIFRFAVIFFEMIGVIWTGSSALLLDAIASFADVASSVFLMICMKLAIRPPDHDHPFGHGRYEPIGGLLLGVLLIVLGIVMFFQQLLGVFREEVAWQMRPWAWIFPAAAMVALEIAYRLLIRVAKEQHSPALAADALHYRIDGLTSLFATIALIVAAIWPKSGVTIDHLGALFISIFMVILGFAASRKNFNQLMDKKPDAKYFSLVKKAAMDTGGVEGTEKIRIQQYGPDAHVDIDIEVNPLLTVAKAHKISQQVRLQIQKAWPSVRDVSVHIEPFYRDDH